MNRWQEEIQALGALPDYMVIGGEHVGSNYSNRIAVIDPGSGAALGSVPAGTIDDLNAAVNHAKKAALGPWRDISPKDRMRLLWHVGDVIRTHVERLSIIECLDSGKPLKAARASVERTADLFGYYAGMVEKLQGETMPLGNGKVCFTEIVAKGVTGHIVPWNVPITAIARGVAPSLACGNAVVIKPAEDTPFTAILLADILLEAGIPPGVANVVTGHGAQVGAALAEHPDVQHVTFTGSVTTGKSVMKAAADHVASVTLELGGKSAHVVLKDADLSVAAPDVLKGIFTNAGQVCSSGSRLLVDRSIHQEFVSQLVTLAENMTIGHGLDDPDMGPLISEKQLQGVCGYVERARKNNADIIYGGKIVSVEGCENGHYYQPTIIDGVDPDDELAQCEIFGPVLTVIPIDGVDQAIEIANNSAYGLAAGIHTRDISTAMRFARGVETGQVYINGYSSAGDTVPFGGVKHSGIGREKGLAALENYCDVKAIVITL